MAAGRRRMPRTNGDFVIICQALALRALLYGGPAESSIQHMFDDVRALKSAS